MCVVLEWCSERSINGQECKHWRKSVSGFYSLGGRWTIAHCSMNGPSPQMKRIFNGFMPVNAKVLKLMQSLSRNLWLNITTEWTCWQHIIYSNTVSLWGEMSILNLGQSGHLPIFTLLKHSMRLLKYSQLCLSRIRISRRCIQVLFFKYSIVFNPS